MKKLGTLNIYQDSGYGGFRFRLIVNVDTNNQYEGLEGTGDTFLEALEDLITSVEVIDGAY